MPNCRFYAHILWETGFTSIAQACFLNVISFYSFNRIPGYALFYLVISNTGSFTSLFTGSIPAFLFLFCVYKFAGECCTPLLKLRVIREVIFASHISAKMQTPSFYLNLIKFLE